MPPSPNPQTLSEFLRAKLAIYFFKKAEFDRERLDRLALIQLVTKYDLRKWGKKKRGERGVSEIFIGGKIAGDKTSNRKQNLV